MGGRDSLISGFVAEAGWGGAAISPLAGDASSRRYLRLRRADGESAVLMDAPVDRERNIGAFARIAAHLRGLGLSAPDILRSDEAAGLLLAEDLGDSLFARILDDQPELEGELYGAATDLLAALHSSPAPAGLETYDAPLMGDLAALALDWYAPEGGDGISRRAFCGAIETALAEHACETGVLVQRDFHSENALWLPERDGLARVGLLDFQDAMLGHRAYDLVSLLQDARRDVAPETETAMIARYIAQAGLPEAGFRTAYAALGAQRNLRILGVFARLCIRDGKPRYVDMIPRVWGLLQRDLAHSALAEMRAMVMNALPAPEPDILERLKNRCATVQTPQ